MSKTILTILGVVIIVIGIWGLIPSWNFGSVAASSWYAIVEIVVGLIAVYIGATASK
jgi:hypothetical protein